MFCINCGTKIFENDAFCKECGTPTAFEVGTKNSDASSLDQKWWLRLSKVIYIGLYIPLPLVAVLVWNANSSTYNYYTRTYTDTFGEAFWYSFLTFIIWLVVLKLIKITFLYVALAQKPRWKAEFKKVF